MLTPEWFAAEIESLHGRVLDLQAIHTDAGTGLLDATQTVLRDALSDRLDDLERRLDLHMRQMDSAR